MLYRPFYRHKLPIGFLIKPNKWSIARKKKSRQEKPPATTQGKLLTKRLIYLLRQRAEKITLSPEKKTTT